MNINTPYFNEIPPEISLIIFSNLKPLDLLVGSLVSSSFKVWAEDESLWRAIAADRKITFDSQKEIKKQVNDHCLQFVQLLKRIFPEIKLPSNRYEEYDVIKNYIETHQEEAEFKKAIQVALDECSTSESPETVDLLIGLGAKMSPSFVHQVVNKIKDYSMKDSNSLSSKYRLSRQMTLSPEQSLDFMKSLKVLGIYIKAGGKIMNSKDRKLLISIALKHGFYELAKELLSHYIKSTRGDDTFTDILDSIVSRSKSYQTEDLPQIIEMVSLLLSAGADGSFSEIVERLDSTR